MCFHWKLFNFPFPGAEKPFPLTPGLTNTLWFSLSWANLLFPQVTPVCKIPPRKFLQDSGSLFGVWSAAFGDLSSAAPQSKHCESLLKQRRKIFSLIFDKFKQPGKRARISLLRPSGASEVWESPGAPSSPRTLPLVYNPPLRKGLRLPIIDCILSTICKFKNCVDVGKNICEKN